MRRNIFLSYVFEDYAYREQVKDWARRSLLGAVDIVTEMDDIRQGGLSAIRAHLRPIMRSADALLVLVGQDTHNRRWVDEEIHYCASSSKPIIVTRLPNSTGAAPPEVRGIQMVRFAPQDIRAAIADAFGGI
jgi:hypothetical protein